MEEEEELIDITMGKDQRWSEKGGKMETWTTGKSGKSQLRRSNGMFRPKPITYSRRAQRFIFKFLGIKSGFIFTPIYQHDCSSDPQR